MGRKHPQAGLFNPSRRPPNYLKGHKAAIKGYDAAESAGLDLPTKSAIAKLPVILGGQYKQFKSAARDVLIAAGLGATYDRHAECNSDREAVRSQLEQYRLSDTPLTSAAVGRIIKGTAYQAVHTELKKEAANPDEPTQSLALAMEAVAPPNDIDPYDCIKNQCGCSTTKSQKAHTNPKSLCGGSKRRNVNDLFAICDRLHEEVRSLQKSSKETRAAVDLHTNQQLKKAAQDAEDSKVGKLSLMSQRTHLASRSSASPASSNKAGQQIGIGSFFAKPPAGRGAIPVQNSTAAPGHNRDGDCDALITSQVNLLVAALELTHGGKNGDPVTVALSRHRFGPKDQQKNGAAPGVLPVGLRGNLRTHLQRLDDEDDGVGLTMSHPRGNGIIAGVSGSRRGRPVTADYHPNSKTIVFDFSRKWAKPALALAGYDCVPCDRPGCEGKTTPVTASSTAHGTRIHIVFDPDGSMSGGIARHSICFGCKEYHRSLLKPGEKLSPSKYTFPHNGRTVLSRIPPELLNDSIVHPDYINSSAAYWPSRALSAGIEYDVVCKQGFEDVARKLADSIDLLQEEIDDQYESDVLEWWEHLNQTVGDHVWAELSHSDQLRLMNQRAERLYFARFKVKGAELPSYTSRPTSINIESMYLEFIERYRLPLVAEYQSTVPRKGGGIGVDATFDVAGRIGKKGENLVTVTRQDGSLVALMNLKSGSADSVAKFLGAVSQREGYPQDNSLILNIDDRKVMAVPGSASEYELTLIGAALAKAAVQDFFHVIKHFNTFFNSHHPLCHYWSSVRFRDCARIRSSEMEHRVDAMLRNGKIASTVKFNRETHAIQLDQPVAQETIDAMKQSGLYHEHFSTSKDGRGAAVPYTVRCELDMDDRLSEYEAAFIPVFFEQTFTFIGGQKVRIDKGVAANTTGVVGPIVPGAVAVGGLKVLLEGGQFVVATRDQLVPVDLALVWSPATHRSTPRGQVRGYCDRFRFRQQRSKHGGKLMIASVDEFLHQVANARARLSLCRPPSDVPQYEPSVNAFTGVARTWNGLQLYRQLHNTNGSENNHKRIQDIHESSNYSTEMAGALTLWGVNDKNRRNMKRKGGPTTGHNHVWTSVRRKSRRIDNEEVFGSADRTMPPCLKWVTVPSEEQLSRAAPSKSPLDQPGLCVWDRFDAKLGRGKVSKSGAVAAPLPKREVRPAIGAGIKREQLDTDSVKLAITMSMELDNVLAAVEACRTELIQGGATDAAAAAAKHRFGKALADVACKYLTSNRIDPNVLPTAVRDTIMPVNAAKSGTVKGCDPVSSPGSHPSPGDKRKAEPEPAPASEMVSMTPPSSTTKPTKAPRLAMTFANRNGKDNHPCTCGNRHVHIEPTVDTAVKLRGVPGHKGLISCTVTSVRGSEATVRLDPKSAAAVETRVYVVEHSALVYPGTGKRCTPKCRTQLLGQEGQCPIIDDRASIINCKGEAIGVLRCDGSDRRLHLKPNGQHMLIGWAWM